MRYPFQQFLLIFRRNVVYSPIRAIFYGSCWRCELSWLRKAADLPWYRSQSCEVEGTFDKKIVHKKTPLHGLRRTSPGIAGFHISIQAIWRRDNPGRDWRENYARHARIWELPMRGDYADMAHSKFARIALRDSILGVSFFLT